MSGYYNRNNRGITKKLGPVTAYADAVLAGYTGTREQWAQEMAKLGQNVTQVAQNTELTTELAAQTRVNTEQVAKDTADVRRLADETSDNAVQVASNTAESNRLAKETKQAAAQAKADAEYAGAAADNFRVDTTLSEEGKAAEAKTAGEKFAQLSEDIDNETKNRQNAVAQESAARNSAIAQERNRAVARENEIEGLFTMPTQEAVDKWLDEHPEATTTVQDKSLTKQKFAHNLIDYITPQMFGAVGDGVHDDTQAFQNTFNFVKHEYYDKGGLQIVIPTPSKFYKITDTLDLTELWNIKISSNSNYGRQRQVGVDVETDYKLIHWYGESGKPVFLFDYTFNAELENISINGRNIAGFGFKIANATVNANKYIVLRNCSAFHCDIGCSIGNTANQTDECPITLYDCSFERNTSKGIVVNSGNDSVKMFGGMISQNGTNAEDGCNIQVNSGEVSFIGVTTDGEPQKADIVQNGGGLTLVDFWSDVTQGKLYYGGGSTITRLNMTSVRHYDGAMTRENTPTSIEYDGKAALVLSSCYLYGDVTVNNGSIPKVVDIGTRFANENATFNGTAIEQFNALVSICSGDFDNHFAVGKNTSNTKAMHEINGRNNIPCALKTADNFAITETLNNGDNSETIYFNCYYDVNTAATKSVDSGKCVWLRISAYSIFVKTATATSADEVLTFTDVFTINAMTEGSNNGLPSLLLGRNKIMWESATPTIGTHKAGDIIINRNFNGSNNWCWVCSSTGEWIAK